MSSIVEQIESLLHGLSRDELSHVLDLVYEHLEDTDERIALLRRGEKIVIPIKRNYIDYGYLGVTDHLDFFPDNVIAEQEFEPERHLIIYLDGVNGEHKAQIKSQRFGRLTFENGAWQQFIEVNGITTKHSVVIERKTPYKYWISRNS